VGHGTLARVLDPSLPIPTVGRSFRQQRAVQLADMDATGRVRLDAIARFLQDIAIDDVQETGWGMPDHLWFVRRIRVEVRVPLLEDREIELVTWCSGLAAIAAGRRWSVRGDRGGSVEVDSVWIHLGPDQRPARIESFGIYPEATRGRPVSTRLELPVPPGDAPRAPWPLRSTDVDLHGHVNNAVYWQAIEDTLASRGFDLQAPLVAELDYRDPIDLSDPVELATYDGEGAIGLGFCVGETARAVARVWPPLASK
jgi:acyl-ACP thioesterase